MISVMNRSQGEVESKSKAKRISGQRSDHLGSKPPFMRCLGTEVYVLIMRPVK